MVHPKDSDKPVDFRKVMDKRRRNYQLHKLIRDAEDEAAAKRRQAQMQLGEEPDNASDR